MRRAHLLLALFAAACASSTGVVSTGSDEYMLSKTDIGDVWHQGSNVLAQLYREANEYCGGRGLTVQRISEETQDGRVFVRPAGATLRFRCVASAGH